jgi:DNA replication ATP-dependent helicase Dna2
VLEQVGSPNPIRRVNKQYDILDGIQAELDATPKYLGFKVRGSERENGVWRVYVELTNVDSSGLDESLEGSAAWWAGPPKGGADVLSVIPESEQINLRFATSPPPLTGQLIRIYPPQYLETLHDCWSNDSWADLCLIWLQETKASNSFEESLTPDPRRFKWLRRRQTAAFKLPGWDAGFLWGPPGTGKTTTLGAMLAQYLVQFPTSKILLLSTTNIAVDQALVATDKAVEQLGQSGATVRRKCLRVGFHFVASQYVGREHLLPIQDPRLIQLMAALEAQQPDPGDVGAYASWKERVEQLRAEMRRQAAGVLDDARLAAMTTTRAVFTFEELYKRKWYDLVVFDEASQVGLAHALALAPLGNRSLFAGDPKQLAPIVRSSDSSAKQWLGKSMFTRMKAADESTCLLNEQSRMAAPICQIVSDVFYDGKLEVAHDCRNNQQWESYRQLISVHPIGGKHAHVQLVATEGTWSQRYHGPIRYESAQFVCGLVCDLKTHLNETDIVVLTPFRAQRTLIKTFLRNAGCRHVMVSTVHRAQGSERHTVIFDPALGNTQFLQTEDAPRLINVALSRAQARLVIMLSAGDRGNPLFDQIFNVIVNADQLDHAVPIGRLISRGNFPSCALNRIVRIQNRVGRITEILEDGRFFVLMDFRTGEKRRYVTSYVVRNFG